MRLILFRFHAFAEEERMFLRSVQFREDDIVLLRPCDSHAFTEEESWVGRSRRGEVPVCNRYGVKASLWLPRCWRLD